MKELVKKLTSISVIASLLLTISFITNAHVVPVEDGYIRASIPGLDRTAAYFTLHNTAGESIELIGASSPISQRLELHQHIMTDEMMQMRKVEQIIIPARSKLVLGPAGYHIMIMDLTKRLSENDQIALTLHFSDHPDVDVILPVYGIKNRPSVHQH